MGTNIMLYISKTSKSTQKKRSDLWLPEAGRGNWMEVVERYKLPVIRWISIRDAMYNMSWLIGKDPDAVKDWGQEEKGMTEDETVGWHHWLNGHGFGWTLGVADGQGGLACCGSWGCRVRHDWATELNWTETWKTKQLNRDMRFLLSLKYLEVTEGY